MSDDYAPAGAQPEPEPDEASDPSPPSGPEGQQLSEYADPAVEVPPEPAEPEGRRYPSTIGGAVYLVALAVSIAGTVLVTRGHWRAGIVWIASALIGAAVGRLLLPRSQAGMLEVRRRSLDVVVLAGFGIALLVLTASIKAR